MAILIGLVLVLAVLLVPAIQRGRIESRRASCASNLKSIGLCLVMYAQDYSVPPRLDDFSLLVKGGFFTDLNMFVCPSTGKQPGLPENVNEWTDYKFFPVKDPASNDFGPHMYCEHEHDGGSNILYADGHVEWMSGEWPSRNEK